MCLLNKNLIWILEDDFDLATVIGEVAEMTGFQVQIFEKVKEIRAAFAAKDQVPLLPQYMLSDLNLKDGQSLSFLAEVRTVRPDIRLTCFSASLDRSVRVRLEALGIPYRDKPSSIEEVLRLLIPEFQ